MADAGQPRSTNTPKNKGGRPVKRGQVDLQTLTKLSLIGATDQQIANFFNLSVHTVWEYKKTWAAFSEALKAGRVQSDNAVVNSLYQRALGYDAPDKTIGSVQTLRHYPPDVTACIFWLKNRRPDEWRDVHAIESRFIFEFVGRLSQSLNGLLPEKCPHCRKALTLREETIRTLEQISAELDASKGTK